MTMRLMTIGGLFLLVVIFTWLSAFAEPATQPTSKVSDKVATIDASVERILDRLEKKKVHDVEATIYFIKEDPVLEDKQEYEGVLRFIQDKPNPRFFIRFDKFKQEGYTSNKKEWHVFDGQWYIEARESTKSIVKRRIVRPGEEIDVFKIGQGPFPLPFGQKKADILRHFSVRLLPPDPKDKNLQDTDHLECTPLPGTEMEKKYGKVHFYIDRELDLPVCVRTIEKEEGNKVAATFPPKQIKVNTGLAGSKLNLPESELRDYSIQTEDHSTPAESPAGGDPQ